MTKLSRANLATQDSTVLLQDNTTNDILPSEHRQANINIHDSFLSLVDDNIDKDADTSLKYLSDPSGAWDSSITHDLKLTPKVYVDDLVNNSLSGYAKLDGTNMPFTGDFVSQEAYKTYTTGFNINNTHPNGSARYKTYSNSAEGIFLATGTNYHTTYTYLNSLTLVASTKNLSIMSNADTPSGGADSIDFFVGGYLLSQRLIRLKNSEVVAEFAKAIKLGDSTTTEAGALRYNTTTNKHQGYNGTTWNDLY